MTKSMEILLNLEREDWEVFQSYTQREISRGVKSSSGGFWRSVLFLSVMSLIALFYFQGSREFHWPTATFVALIFTLIAAQFLYNLNKVKDASAPGDEGPFCGRHRLVISEDGISSEGNGYAGLHDWTTINKIERSDGLIMLYIDTLFAFIFPESKLEDPDALFAYVNRLYENANESSV